jgi:hypothetical protein
MKWQILLNERRFNQITTAVHRTRSSYQWGWWIIKNYFFHSQNYVWTNRIITHGRDEKEWHSINENSNFMRFDIIDVRQYIKIYFFISKSSLYASRSWIEMLKIRLKKINEIDVFTMNLPKTVANLVCAFQTHLKLREQKYRQ